MAEFLSLPPVRRGDRVAVLSPSWPAAAYFPDVHQRALARIRSELGLVPVSFPGTAQLGVSFEQRAADLHAAFADPDIKAILSTMGGDDQIQLIPYLDGDLIKANPKRFIGYSDNTNIANFLWSLGVGSFYGSATLVHLAPGSQVPPSHLQSLRWALFGAHDVALPCPEVSVDHGFDLGDPRVLDCDPQWGPALPVEFIGPNRPVRGRTWGGCLEVLDQLAWAGRLPDVDALTGAVLFLETSPIQPQPQQVGRWLRGLGEAGVLDAVAGIIFARPITATVGEPVLSVAEAAARTDAYLEFILGAVGAYRSDLLVCFNLPAGHTLPNVVIPYGGMVTLDPLAGEVRADF